MNVTHIILMCVSANPKVGSPSEWVAQLGALCDNTCVILYISISPRQEGRRHTVSLTQQNRHTSFMAFNISVNGKKEGGESQTLLMAACTDLPSTLWASCLLFKTTLQITHSDKNKSESVCLFKSTVKRHLQVRGPGSILLMLSTNPNSAIPKLNLSKIK